jgi:hypothetical protein
MGELLVATLLTLVLLPAACRTVFSRDGGWPDVAAFVS